MSSFDVGLCPTAGCDERVTLADLAAADRGEPIWACSGGHLGPTIVGVSRDDEIAPRRSR